MPLVILVRELHVFLDEIRLIKDLPGGKSLFQNLTGLDVFQFGADKGLSLGSAGVLELDNRVYFPFKGDSQALSEVLGQKHLISWITNKIVIKSFLCSKAEQALPALPRQQISSMSRHAY